MFIYSVNQILASLLKYFLLRHVNLSGFVDQHKKESMEQHYCHFTKNINIRNHLLISRSISKNDNLFLK